MSQIIMQGRCIPNKYALNIRLIRDFFYQNVLGCCTWVAVAILLQFLHFLLNTSRRIQKGAGFNKRAGRIVTSTINKRAGSNKAVQGCIKVSKRINAHARLLET